MALTGHFISFRRAARRDGARRGRSDGGVRWAGIGLVASVHVRATSEAPVALAPLPVPTRRVRLAPVVATAEEAPPHLERRGQAALVAVRGRGSTRRVHRRALRDRLLRRRRWRRAAIRRVLGKGAHSWRQSGWTPTRDDGAETRTHHTRGRDVDRGVTRRASQAAPPASRAAPRAPHARGGARAREIVQVRRARTAPRWRHRVALRNPRAFIHVGSRNLDPRLASIAVADIVEGDVHERAEGRAGAGDGRRRRGRAHRRAHHRAPRRRSRQRRSKSRQKIIFIVIFIIVQGYYAGVIFRLLRRHRPRRRPPPVQHRTEQRELPTQPRELRAGVPAEPRREPIRLRVRVLPRG